MLAGIVAKLLGRGLFVAGLVLLVGVPAPAQASLSFSAPSTVDRNAANRLRAVACPSASQCTAVDETGQQVTFNPASPGSPTPTAIDSYVNQRLAMLASTKHGLRGWNWATRFDDQWVASLGVHRFSGTIKPTTAYASR